MNLPPIDNRRGEWQPVVLAGWVILVEKANRMKAKVGGSDAFERMLAQFRDMASTGRFEGLQGLLGRRLGARALTWLWLHDDVVGPRLFNSRMLDVLIEHQHPRLSRLTLIQLVQLYFRYFDRLDERDRANERSVREQLERHLMDQLMLLPESRHKFVSDPLVTLKHEGGWLLTLDGPLTLAKTVRDQGGELGKTFETLGLNGFDVGRFGDVCRAHFYLEVLRELSPGEWDDVLDELLKPSVSKAPYEGDKRIGHVALEIMIDRAGDDPGEAWQNFILNLAGDPRIASSAANFREWWKPLGEERIGKVRGWLSKEDLRLFLQAVEQYGKETSNAELRRMFPARKVFLEGLFRLGLIRHTRLLLGKAAQEAVRRILGSEVKTSFARMDGNMNDKAVIYLDCGDFHLVEGSHSFKIWSFLAAPGATLKSYDKNLFSHADLTITLPRDYKKLYPTLDYEAVPHHGTWQRKVFEFLGSNGIGLDIEQLLSKRDYKFYLSKYGMPSVSPQKVHVPQPLKPRSEEKTASAASSVLKKNTVVEVQIAKPKAERVVSPLSSESSIPRKETETERTGLSDLQRSMIDFLAAHPESLMGDIYRGLRDEGVTMGQIKSSLEGGLSIYASKDSVLRWSLTTLGTEYVGEPLSNRTVTAKSTATAASVEAVKMLGDLERRVLQYFADNPGDRVRFAANVFGVEAREINQILYGPLKRLCFQRGDYGWAVEATVVDALNHLQSK